MSFTLKGPSKKNVKKVLQKFFGEYYSETLIIARAKSTADTCWLCSVEKICKREKNLINEFCLNSLDNYEYFYETDNKKRKIKYEKGM